MYVWLIQGVGNSIQGLNWLWLILAVLMDFATIGIDRAYRAEPEVFAATRKAVRDLQMKA